MMPTKRGYKSRWHFLVERMMVYNEPRDARERKMPPEPVSADKIGSGEEAIIRLEPVVASAEQEKG